MTYGALFNLFCLICFSTILASVMVHAEDTDAPSPDAHQHHEHQHHEHQDQDSKPHNADPQPQQASGQWAELLDLEGPKASAVANAERDYHEQRRALKKKHYAEMMALEKDKLESLERVLSKDELAQLQALWVQQLRDEHRHH